MSSRSLMTVISILAMVLLYVWVPQATVMPTVLGILYLLGKIIVDPEASLNILMTWITSAVAFLFNSIRKEFGMAKKDTIPHISPEATPPKGTFALATSNLETAQPDASSTHTLSNEPSPAVLTPDSYSSTDAPATQLAPASQLQEIVTSLSSLVKRVESAASTPHKDMSPATPTDTRADATGASPSSDSAVVPVIPPKTPVFFGNPFKCQPIEHVEKRAQGLALIQAAKSPGTATIQFLIDLLNTMNAKRELLRKEIDIHRDHVDQVPKADREKSHYVECAELFGGCAALQVHWSIIKPDHVLKSLEHYRSDTVVQATLPVLHDKILRLYNGIHHDLALFLEVANECLGNVIRDVCDRKHRYGSTEMLSGETEGHRDARLLISNIDF